ncbi:MAG: LuxR C-terminal-related transcriptional regulator [Actinomycetota bacterium]
MSESRPEPIIVAAKLRPPRPFDDSVSRCELVDRLAAPEGDVLRLVAAPAGWGKSQLLAQWLERHPGPVAYVLVDDLDHDITRFWRHVLAAVGSCGAVVDDLVAALRSPDTDVRSEIVEPLVVRLEGIPDLLLVLEDLHTVTSLDVLESIDTLLDRHLENVTVGILSRSDPEVHLPRRRLEGRLCEVRTDALRIGTRDGAELLRAAAGTEISHGLVGDLVRKTEGWPAGIYLAGLSMRGARDPASFVGRFAGDDRMVGDYLSSEVLSRLSEEHADFLTSVAVLERFDSDLCDALLDRTDSARVLDELARGNLFVIPGDEHRREFRLHQLFRDRLLTELERSAPTRRIELEERAAHALAERGQIVLAIEHALAAREPETAARLMKGAAPDLLGSGAIDTLDRWLGSLPVMEDPSLDSGATLLRGWVALMHGDLTTVAAQCDITRRVLRRLPDSAARRRRSNQTDILDGYRAALNGQFDEAATLASRAHSARDRAQADPAMRWLTASSRYWQGEPEGGEFEIARTEATESGDVFTILLSEAFLALLALDRDDVADADRWTTEAFATAATGSVHNFGQMAPAHLARARLLVRRGDVERAAIDARRAVDLAERRGDVPVRLSSVLTLAEALHASGHDVVELVHDVRRSTPLLDTPGVVGRHLGIVERVLRADGIDTPLMTTPVEPLTDRERSLLQLLPGTLSQRELGEALHVSFNTIKTHNRQIYRKLGVTSRDAAVARARALGLL